MRHENLSRIGQVMLERKAVETAVRLAIRDAILEHKREGLPMVIERDGRIVWISAEEADRELNEGDQT